jgi:hypothetical protein
MASTEDRYGRALRRYNLALKLIREDVRTQTIRIWTGMSRDSVKRLCALYRKENAHHALVRPRGPSPRQAARFLRSKRIRSEAAIFAGICYRAGILPSAPMPQAPRLFPGLARGEELYAAFLRFRVFAPASELTLEQLMGLALILAERIELALTRCVSCGAMVLGDNLGVLRRWCGECAQVSSETPRPDGAATGRTTLPGIAGVHSSGDSAANAQGSLFP